MFSYVLVFYCCMINYHKLGGYHHTHLMSQFVQVRSLATAQLYSPLRVSIRPKAGC